MIKVDQVFIDQFLTLARLDLNSGGVAGELLRRCVVDAIDKPSRPFFLPAPRPSGTVWFVLPRTPQQSRILRDQVKSFLSFPYSDYDGTRGSFDNSDPIDQLILGTFGELAIKIQARTSAIEKASFNKALKRLLDLLDEQPDRSLDLARSLQRVRQDFEWALAAKDVEGSQKYLHELTANGRLSQENIWYLQIQRWASLELWHQIIDHPDLADLLYLRRPTKVTYSILRAFSKVYLDDSKLSRAELANLLKNEPLSGIRDVRLILNDHLSSDIAQIYQEIQDLLSGHVGGSEVSTEEFELTDFELAQKFFEIGEFFDALELLKNCPDDAKKLGLTLRICFEVPGPDVIARSIELRNAVPVEALDELLGQKETADLLHWLTEQAVGDQVIVGLHEWLKAFEGEIPDSRLEEIFREQSESWNIDSLNGDSAVAISSLMESIIDSSRSTLLMRMLPGIHGLVANVDPTVRAPVLRSSFFILAIQDQLTAAELGALQHVADTLFDLVNTEERHQILHEILNIWVRIANPRRISWFLDVAASIKATSGPNDLQSRDTIIQMSSIVAGLMPGTLEPGYQTSARVILSGIYDLEGWSGLWQVGETEAEIVRDPFEALNGKSIGIYCLEQARAQRMANALMDVCDCSVSLNHDYVGSTALANIAQSSDLMIIITSAAKHAATECIGVNRGNKPVLYIHSTGVSTFLRSVEAFLDQDR